MLDLDVEAVWVGRRLFLDQGVVAGVFRDDVGELVPDQLGGRDAFAEGQRARFIGWGSKEMSC